MGKAQKVFDWDKAAKILKEAGVDWAEAGLATDWSCTAGTILSDGKPVTSSYAYLASTWAIPTLAFNDEEVPCWVSENDTEWNSGTCWPESALEIFNS